MEPDFIACLPLLPAYIWNISVLVHESMTAKFPSVGV